ncbi:MAG: glycosyltransferase [Bacteroidales bacterium]|nr:glycosyltransferase [Bacteroidales bacterium]
MTLSIVIVNYNVKHYLRQCLFSLYAAAEGIDCEVFVVDNNSSDGSLEMLHDAFPQVKVIANSDNKGFAYANNQALRIATGDYILLLNPDTILQQDTLNTCINFISNTPRCGGISVKMINGDGVYLKESKRGFPSPRTSFYKISGLINLLPHHPKVAAYYMGHLSDNATSIVDVLPGAFIMLRRNVLEEVGLLDEEYFMYGEDIDFSWRIHLAGYDNYYLPTTRILHYKGESTRKGSMNYVYTFYNAMSIFVQRYFSGSGAKAYNLLMQIAIWLRAVMAMCKRFALRVAMPLFDFLSFSLIFWLTKEVWSTYWAANVNYYPDIYTYILLPLYALLLVFATWINGGYDKPLKIKRIIGGIVIGGIALLVFYSLLDESMRYSRAILLFGTILSVSVALLSRFVLGLLGVEGYQMWDKRQRDYLIIGDKESRQQLKTTFDRIGIRPHTLQEISPKELSEMLAHSITPNHVEEIVFCTPSVTYKLFLDAIELWKTHHFDFRTAPSYDDVLIGGNYVHSIENVYSDNTFTIAETHNQRNKRLFDFLTSFSLLLLSPLFFFFQRYKQRYFTDCWHVMIGRKSWVGYSLDYSHLSEHPLPHIKQSIFKTSDIMPHVKTPDLKRLDIEYARQYGLTTDLAILVKNIMRI